MEKAFYYVDNQQSYDSYVKHVAQIDVVAPSCAGDTGSGEYSSTSRTCTSTTGTA